MLGLLSDSHGDLDAFDAGYELLKGKGAKRFLFLGARYTDLDDWLQRRKDRARGGRAYSDQDFLKDITNYLSSQEPIDRGAAFDDAPAPLPCSDNLQKLMEHFVRTPERDCLHYRNPEVAKKAVELLGDALCCAVHDKNDLDKEDLLNATFFVHGKESEPKVVQIGPRYFVTPGRLAGAAEQTCGLLDFQERTPVFTAYRLDGKVLIERQRMMLERKTKLSVK